jgi:hypothetical protein
MKNLFVLPTDKPSRLFLKENTLLLNNQYTLQEVFPKGKCQNIYITSDEEIKAGDWFINTANNFISFASEEDKDLNNFSYVKKIILTDNKDLIKDGVQAIDDEFLEWFIKNLNCEEVKIVNNWDYNNKGFVDHSGYKIIIPKEELSTKLHIGEVVDESYPKDFIKQETLEEAYDRIYKSIDFTEFDFASFAIGAKWQQEQDKNKYSEEEIIDLIQFLSMYEEFNQEGFVSKETAKYFLEKFKNK